jgi:hypothetical protein
MTQEAVTLLAALVALGVALIGLALAIVAWRDRRGPSARDEPQTSRPSGLERRPVVQAVPASGSAGEDDQGEARGRGLRRVGLVRFDAFEDTGGSQSFALALIDEAGDGVVLTSLHSRQASRLYVKRVIRGVSETTLSREEDIALREAARAG